MSFLDELDATARKITENTLEARPCDAFALQLGMVMDYYGKRLAQLPEEQRAFDKTFVVHELMRHIAGFAAESPEPERALEVLTANLRAICKHLVEPRA
jgi:hypothetical protein